MLDEFDKGRNFMRLGCKYATHGNSKLRKAQ